MSGSGEASEPPEGVGDAADETAIETVRRRQRKSKDEAGDFWRGVFADRVGRRVMWDLLQAAHTFETVFACGPNGFPQTEATWFKAGEQGFGLRLYHTWLKIDPDGVRQMHLDHNPDFARPKRQARS